MKTQIISIGNSQGVRIPKILLEQSKLSGEVELELKDEGILIRPARKPREGWAEAFREMAANGDDELLDGDLVNQSSFDEEEWEW
jgi:antitoxin MazE